MGLLQLLGFGNKQSVKQLRELLPAIHSFIDCLVRGGPSGQVCFEAVGLKSITVSKLEGMKAGQTAVFSYTSPSGKYSFTSTISAVGDRQATLAMPTEIKVLQKFAGARQRAGVRVDTTVNAQWRFTPAGRIATEYQRATLSDLSRGGAQLTVDRELKVGEKLDVSIQLAEKPLLVKAEVRRVDKGRTGKFNAGLRFLDIGHDAEGAIAQFINRRQADLRNRGLA